MGQAVKVDREQQVLELIAKHPAITLRELGAQMNLSLSTAHYYVERLRQSRRIVRKQCGSCEGWTWVAADNGRPT